MLQKMSYRNEVGAYFNWINNDTREMIDLPKGSYTFSVYIVSTGECVKAKTITVD